MSFEIPTRKSPRQKSKNITQKKGKNKSNTINISNANRKDTTKKLAI